MIDNDKCVNNYVANGDPNVQFEIHNGECNMRRSRKIGPDQRGVEQSITIVISFHDTFITKVDRAYRCTCFYMEADKIVTNRFEISDVPTTDLVDTAKMPLCTYSVRRGSVNGPIVSFATIGEPVFHVWQCDSDMFSMLVHSCFVDDGAGHDRKPILDEHGCTIEPVIVPELTYNHQNNLAYTEVSVFKFADKVTTYFQCAVSTCMISEGMCRGKTPPRCSSGFKVRARRDYRLIPALQPVRENSTDDGFAFTTDVAAEKIVVFDLDDLRMASVLPLNGEHAAVIYDSRNNNNSMNMEIQRLLQNVEHDRVCISQPVIILMTGVLACVVAIALVMIVVIGLKYRSKFLNEIPTNCKKSMNRFQ
uniref:ZP domain-containing protein n=1 Tax=Acrobeloides nanus TaxID=290746 RepID=A0A914C0A6_9BILA